MTCLPSAPDCSRLVCPEPSRSARSAWSEDAADDAAFGADRSAVNGDGLHAGHEGDDGGDFLWRFKALQQGCGPRGREELPLDFLCRKILLFGHVYNELAGALGSGRTGENGVDGDAGARDGFGNDAAPIFLEHTGKISASQQHTAQHVNLEEAQPFGVGNFQEWLYIENTQIIDENVCCGSLVEEALDAGGGTEVGGYTAQLGAGYMLLNDFESSVYAGLRAAIYDYRCTFRGERGGNRQADACGRAGHDGRLSLQSEVHFFSL